MIYIGFEVNVSALIEISPFSTAGVSYIAVSSFSVEIYWGLARAAESLRDAAHLKNRFFHFLLSSNIYSASTGINENVVTSNSPISVSLTSGITASDMKHSVITGSTSPQIPSSLYAFS